MINALFSEFSSLPQVEAIALGGSRAGNCYDEKSDYDVYLYCTALVPEELRNNILQKYCVYMEIGNRFWETEDNCTLSNGIDMDILYRNLDDFTADVASVVEQHQSKNGYTTCMWHNLNTCKILFDRNGRLATAKKRFDVSYPQELKQSIVQRNYRLLTNTLPAYDSQIRKAISRNDRVSVNHRISAFLESYFDLLFALNEQTHPGEKRLISLCIEKCSILPDRFEENLNDLLSNAQSRPELVSNDLAKMISSLAKIL